MNLSHWSPFGEVSLQNGTHDLFDSPPQRRSVEPTGGTISWAPTADIYESENELVVHVDLPGVDPKLVNARVENNILTIRGERRFEEKRVKETYHRLERSYGVFARSFSLATAVDVASIRATYKAGVLTITLPKAERAKHKRIEIAAAARA